MKKIATETAEVLEKFNTNINRRIPILTSYLLLFLILKEGFSIPFPYIVFGLVSFMMISTLILAFFFDRLLPKAKIIINGFFLYMLFDLFLLTIIIYFLGGVSWLGCIFYSFYIVLNFMTFPRLQAIFFVVWIVILFLGLTYLQYFQIIPLKSLFDLSAQTYHNFSYVLTTIIALISTLYFLGYFSQGFYQMLTEKIIILREVQKTLQKEKTSLEIKVQARKKELGKERKGLEKRIKERKKELEAEQRELEEKAKELEKFQKIVLGREEKMKELQRELALLLRRDEA